MGKIRKNQKVKTNLNSLEEKLGVNFRNIDILREALTHRSYLNENPAWPLPNNERMEYLGDAVLELAVTEYLYRKYPAYQEGQMTSLRAALVNYQMLAKVARDISLEKFIYLSKGEARDSGKARDVILANAMEAIFGAIYLDSGYESAGKVVESIVLSRLKEVFEKGLYRDAKSTLQENVQEKNKVTPTYRVLKEVGPDHQKKFFVGVFIGEKLAAEGSGFSKQEAEAAAAEAALRLFKDR